MNPASVPYQPPNITSLGESCIGTQGEMSKSEQNKIGTYLEPICFQSVRLSGAAELLDPWPQTATFWLRTRPVGIKIPKSLEEHAKCVFLVFCIYCYRYYLNDTKQKRHPELPRMLRTEAPLAFCSQFSARNFGKGFLDP